MPKIFCTLFLLSLIYTTSAVDDPEAFMTATEIIRYWGYPAESHDVITDDGYILAMHRIPHGRFSEANSSCSRPAVLMVHGQAGDGTEYYMNPPESSPAFILADAGFDVFFLNQRGTTYSKRHVTLKPWDNKFWQYTVDEMSKYDATAVIDKVLELTGQKAVYWIGHSQGTLVGFLTLAGQPEYNSKASVKALLQIGPVGVMHYVKGWTRWGLFWYRTLRPIADSGWMRGLFCCRTLRQIVDFYRFALGSHEVLSSWPAVYRPLSHLCSSIPWLAEEICYENFELLFGPPAKTFNWSRLPVYLSHFPAGTSTWSVLHLAQIVTHARVERMDHNPLENMQRYGQETPPPYNYTNIDVPVYLYWAREDWLTNPEGVEQYIIPNIKKHLLKGGLEVSGYNHLDFTLATDCAERLWNPIVHLLRSLEDKDICGR